MRPIVYVTRDIERALGMAPQGGYFVISNDTPYGRKIRDQFSDNVFLVKAKKLLDTYDLLALPEVKDIISNRSANLLVFQNTARIERLAQENGFILLNPSADLSKIVEEKISQVTWLGEDARLLPSHLITTVKEVKFSNKKFVLQFNHSHTGQGTHVIDSEDALALLRKKFPNRECRITDFVDGPVFTVNAVVGDRVLVGNPSYQITGMPPFTDLPFSTIGNDWSLPQTPQSVGACEETKAIASRIGTRLKKSGWKGLFGIDSIYDSREKKTYLLEINARQPASATFESNLQGSPTIFAAHVAALLGESVPESLPRVSGAQVVKRKTDKRYEVSVKELETKGLSVMEYENAGHNQELFRIQSREGIMEAHGKLNGLGTFIASCIRIK